MYTKKTIIEGYIGKSLDEKLDTFLKLTINAVTNFIEEYCGDERFGRRVFEKPASDTDKTKYFDGNGSQILPVGDLKTLTSLTVDGVLQVVEEDFYLKPYNAEDEGKPYTHLELVQPSGRGNSRIGTIYEFEKDQRNVKVVGKFRYSDSVPADIQLIATKLVAETLKEKVTEEDLREIKAETFDDYKVEFVEISKTAKELGVFKILDQYKRKTNYSRVGTAQI